MVFKLYQKATEALQALKDDEEHGKSAQSYHAVLTEDNELYITDIFYGDTIPVLDIKPDGSTIVDRRIINPNLNRGHAYIWCEIMYLFACELGKILGHKVEIETGLTDELPFAITNFQRKRED